MFFVEKRKRRIKIKRKKLSMFCQLIYFVRTMTRCLDDMTSHVILFVVRHKETSRHSHMMIITSCAKRKQKKKIFAYNCWQKISCSNITTDIEKWRKKNKEYLDWLIFISNERMICNSLMNRKINQWTNSRSSRFCNEEQTKSTFH